MASSVLANESITAMGPTHLAGRHFFNDGDSFLKRLSEGCLACHGVRVSCRCNEVCGCRLASALAGTGVVFAAATGAVKGSVPEVPATVAAGSGNTLNELGQTMLRPAMLPSLLSAVAAVLSRPHALENSIPHPAWPHARQLPPVHIRAPALSRPQRDVAIFRPLKSRLHLAPCCWQ